MALAPPPPLNATAPPFHATVDQPMSLQQLMNGDAINAFNTSIDYIYQHGSHDITQALHDLSIDALHRLRAALVDRLYTRFPELKMKRLVSRRAKSTIVPDIFAMGHSMVNQALHRDVEQMFRDIDTTAATDDSESDPHVSSLDENSDLREVVMQLSRSLSQLRKELHACKEANVELQEQLDELSLNMAEFTAQQHVSHGDHPPRSDALPQNEVQAELCTSDNTQLPRDDDAGTSNALSVDPPPRHPPPLPQETSPSPHGSNNPDPETEYQVVESKKTKKEKKRLNKNGATSESRSQFYVGGVHPQSTHQDAVSFISDKGISISTQHVVQLSSTSQRKSFRIDVMESQVQALLMIRWPTGVYLRPFRPSTTASGGLRGAKKSANGHKRYDGEFGSSGERYGYRGYERYDDVPRKSWGAFQARAPPPRELPPAPYDAPWYEQQWYEQHYDSMY